MQPLSPSFTAHLEAYSHGSSNFGQQSGELTTQVESLVEDFGHTSELWRSALSDFVEHCNTASEALDSSQKETLEACQRGLEEQSASHAELQTQFESLADIVREMLSLLNSAQESTKKCFEQAGSAIAESGEDLDEEAKQTNQAIEEFRNKLTNQHAEELKSRFSEFAEIVETDLGTNLNAKIEEWEVDLTTLLEAFDEDVSNLSAHFESLCGDIWEDLESHAESKVSGRVRELFEELVDECVQELVDEISESVSISTLGAATTASLTPIIPELILIKKAPDLVNDII